MKAVISIVVAILIVYLIFVGWSQYDKYRTDQDLRAKQAAAEAIVPEQLPGMPDGWEQSYKTVQKGGAVAIRNWLRAYGGRVGDPRRAWIELDYMQMISREDPQEAKRIFADVKARTPEDSPIYPRIKLLEKTYQ
jgi:hypothetical protein